MQAFALGIYWLLRYFSANFMQQFGKTGQEFSAYFAVLAGVMGIASFTNSKIVMKFGMRQSVFMAFSVCA